MLDVRANTNVEQVPNTQNTPSKEVPRPRPPLEMPKIESEGNYLTFFSIFAAILVIVAAVGVYVLKSTKASALKTKNAEMQSLTQELGTDPLKTLDMQIEDMQNGLVAYKSAISGQIIWSKTFAELEKIDPKNVKFTAFTVDEKNVIKLTGETSDLTSIAKLIRSLENSTKFSDIKLISSTASITEASAGTINFALSFNLVESSNLAGSSTNSSSQTQVQSGATNTQGAPNQ